MKARLVRVGNSHGVRIPKTEIEQCSFEDEVELTVKDDRLIIAPARGRQIASEELMAPEECARTFSRNDEFKRQLVLWADAAPMILQRIEYFDEDGPFSNVFAGTYESIS